MTRPPFLVALITLYACFPVSGVVAQPPELRSESTMVEQSVVVLSDLAATERIRAQARGLSASEWQRYRTLMSGIRGSVSPATLSPIEVLGIHARDEGERRRYAEKWAVMMRQDAERILAFQRAYDDAGQLLYPDEYLIDRARLPDNVPSDLALIATDRILLFIQADGAVSDAIVERLLSQLDRVAGIDIYLVGIAAGEANAVRDWAAAQGISPQWVTTRRVTLNFEGGALAQLAPGQRALPYLMRRRGDAVTPLPATAL